MGKKKIKKRLTIERQLEKYYEKEKHAERNAVLWHAWCQIKDGFHNCWRQHWDHFLRTADMMSPMHRPFFIILN